MEKIKSYIIAEIGINHNGNMNIAKKLILDAKESGASAAKFQVFQPETLGRPRMQKNKDQKRNSKKSISLDQMWKKVFLNEAKLKVLRKICKKNNLDFICSVFDKQSLNKVLKIGVDCIKIASSDVNDIFLLKEIKKSKKKVIISTGMANLNEIRRAKHILGKKAQVLHCVSVYPCPKNFANLKRIYELKKKLGFDIGYSDHTIGNDACKIAITMGSKVIEKHFTYNKNLLGADHNISADKKDLKEIVQFANNYYEYCGTGKIDPSEKEKKNRKFFRKGIYFSKDIGKNSKISIEDIIFLRPENKIDITKYKKLLGKKLKKNVFKFQEFKESFF